MISNDSPAIFPIISNMFPTIFQYVRNSFAIFSQQFLISMLQRILNIFLSSVSSFSLMLNNNYFSIKPSIIMLYQCFYQRRILLLIIYAIILEKTIMSSESWRHCICNYPTFAGNFYAYCHKLDPESQLQILRIQ